ncbi:nucleoside triphosphate pyrophosphohydrolase [Salinibacillus xinjiangensis]|uniref:Phosphoribosyl-ATP pyrophosphohydrolase n=1 Tax=Salinibacillus xinjiangensis TaxID=1229268 RepID=A0A6G1X4X8_9BACI|nr:nucleoside triphosphate pyrophosphohydrolase [Salinibacillus xinjiangensis]MRG85979.1 phosphoribosyl-ATP pyrophosphohydrolase [Salinibacillus xinjiangensis]
MPTYNKLIRDHIPQIIEMTGKTPKTKILSDEDYKTALQKKTKEELTEYLNAKSDADSIEELADMLELIHALAKVHGSTIDEVEHIRKHKAEQRGGFDEKVYLIEVEE